MENLQFLLSNAVTMFFRVIEILIFARIMLSWIGIGYQNPLGQLLHNLTEPILGPCRNMLDKSPLGGGMGLDFSPVFALILMRLVSIVLLGAISYL